MFRICSNEEQRIIEIEQLRIDLLNDNNPPSIITKEFDQFKKKTKKKQINLKSKI